MKNFDIEYIDIKINDIEYQIEIIVDELKPDTEEPIYGFGTYQLKETGKEKLKTIECVDKEFAVSTKKKKVILYAFNKLIDFIELKEG